MFCSKCGVQNEEGLNFCANCGAPLNAAPAAPVAPQQPVYQQPAYQPAPVVPGKGMGIAGMVLGIIGLVFMCVFYIGIPCAIVGVILSGLASSKAKKAGLKNGMATAGIVCSCIALGFNILWIVGLGAAIGIGM